MAAFTSFHASGFWLVLALLGGVVVVAARPFVPADWRVPLFAGFWIGLPYLALIAGGASPRLMGLLYIDWMTSLRLGVGLTLGLIALAAVVRLSLGRGNAGLSETDRASEPHWVVTLTAVVSGGVEEFFWCFLRGAVLETMLALQVAMQTPLYWSIWIAATLALPLSMAYRESGYARLATLAVLVMTSILFFYTRNFWLCWAVHASVCLLLNARQETAVQRTAASR